MNQGIYKLVYSRVLGMFVPVSELAPSRSKSGRSQSRQSKVRRSPRSVQLVWVQLTTMAMLFVATAVHAELPAGLSVKQIVNDSTRISTSSANSIQFQQLKPRAIVDWNTLNLAKGQSFSVDMQPTWAMLNRIHDTNPSYLNGAFNAKGSLYFLNPYGVVIGKDSTFNVGSIYAGTLDMTDDMFNNGFIKDGANATFTEAFKLVGVIDPDEQAKIDTAQLLVESGAQINAAKNGKVLLFAPNVKVEKDAIIRTPEGQTILAAGNKVYLKGSKDPAGFLVEVDSGGTATNLGKIIAEQGNITMMGLAVNQSGTLSATTTVRANGSIKLIAQEGILPGTAEPTGKRNGVVTLAQGSVTEVLPEVDNKEEIMASAPFKTSKVEIEASLINIDGKISAKGGDVVASNFTDASEKLNSPIKRRIYLGDHADIDVSGVDAEAPMSRNQLAIQLFSDQLRDAPMLRGGPLSKQTVYVDARKGTDLFDIQPFMNLVPATVAEKMSKAGSITLSTAEDLIMSKHAVMDVSGGSITYLPGSIKETRLMYNGELVPISQAKQGVPYQQADVYSVTDKKWGTTKTWDLTPARFSPLYVEGKSAGVVDLTTKDESEITKNLILAGTLKAHTTMGKEQRLAGAAPVGGTLKASAKDLEIIKTVTAAPIAFNDVVLDAENFKSQLSTDVFAQGFNQVDLSKTEKLSVNAPIEMAAKGKLTLGQFKAGSRVDVNANIVAASSSVALKAEINKIADGITISTAGKFTSDKVGAPSAMTLLPAMDGGNIDVDNVAFGKNVTLDASAGAWVDAKGKLHQGKGGDISFSINRDVPTDTVLKSYGFSQGGKLAIEFGQGMEKTLAVGQGNAGADFHVNPAIFSQGGFSTYALSAHQVLIGDDTAAPTSVYGFAQNWVLNADYLTAASGQPMGTVASVKTLPVQNRQAASLGFTGTSFGEVLGSVTLAENATIRTDVGGEVTLKAGKQVNVLGDIFAYGGKINIGINDTDVNLVEDPTQAVFIGDKAYLSVAGSSVQMLGTKPGVIQNRVTNAGSITINEPSKGIQKGALIIKEGAVLDVSGAAAVNDTPIPNGYRRETLYGDAGSVFLNGSGSMLIDGAFNASAAGTGRDGSLTLTYNSQPFNVLSGIDYPNGSGTVVVTDQKQVSAAGFKAGDATKDLNNADPQPADTQYLKAQISAQQIEQGGFANLHIKSFLAQPTAQTQIELANNVNLNLTGNVVLESPIIHVSGDNAHISANHITFKSSLTTYDPATIATGPASFTTQSKQVYVEGVTAISGTKQVALNASADIHGQGTASNVQQATVATNGGLVTNGELQLTARQLYPESGANLQFEALGDDSKLTVNSNGSASTPVLSAGGVLTLKADNIVQNGVIKAPFGVINLQAPKKLTFASGSLTTVSGAGQLIPYATTTVGGQVFNTPGGTKSQSLPEKNINISAGNVDMQSNAKLDLSGGGDVFAYEFVPGIGGSKDVLAQPNTYAIMPGVQQPFAPKDQLYNGSSAAVETGQSVYLTGVLGLADGTYTLMPARYALMPGAFMVQVKSEAALLPGQKSKQLDGSMLTSGYFADATGARDANWSSFRVLDGAVFRPQTGQVSRSPSQYIISNASSFFTNPKYNAGINAALPQDAGRLAIAATKLNIDADIVGNKAQGGSGMQVDISADKIRLVSVKDSADTESLQLTASSLNHLNAESVLLGGTRSKAEDGALINTIAQTVTLENDANHAVNTPELIATAKDHLSVKSGAVVNTGEPKQGQTTERLRTTGDGALLALSSNRNLDYSRTGVSAAATQGTLAIDAGATLNVGKSLVIDATQNVSIDGNVRLADGGSATLGANRILVGDAPSSENGLRMDNQKLAALGKLDSLSLNSQGNLDTYGTVNLGNDNLNLSINAAGIVGHLANGETAAPSGQTSVITAKTFTLKNNQDAKSAAATDASGRTLEIKANTVRFEGETVSPTSGDAAVTQIAGFDQLNVNANEIRVAKQGETQFNVAQTNLNTGRMSGETAASYTLKSNATLNVQQLANAQVGVDNQFGAKLALQADALNVAGNIQVRSGTLQLASQQDLNIASGANINAASTPMAYYNVNKEIDAGSVTFSSGTGNVNVAAGAIVDVSAQGVADAGTVKVQANAGTLNLAGDLRGGADGAGKGGVLNVAVNTLADLSATNSKANGFSEGRHYRVRNGDVNITGTGTNALTAREITVAADAGNINVSGDIIASAPKNSRIGLYANNDVVLQNTAQLKANSTKQGEEGGTVNIHTKTGMLDLRAGASVNVSGGEGGQGGTVNMRAPRTGSGAGNGVAVSNLTSTIVGAQSTVLEAFRTFAGVKSVSTGAGVGATLGQTTIAKDVNAFMSNKDSILASLGKTDAEGFHLRAGTEIQSNASLAINGNWNLYTATRAGDEPGVLTLRAKDNISFNGSLSDGFVSATSNSDLGLGDSWSYRIVSGADIGAADVMATNTVTTKDANGNASTGNLTLNNGTAANINVIRTGTGSIEIATGGDLKMGGVNTAIYTAGKKADDLAGFDTPDSNKPTYLTQGGDIRIATQGNIVGGESLSNRQLINQWLYREGGGTGNRDTTWWVRPDLFKQGLATLGGGDIDIVAGGSISNFSASAPTTARFDNFGVEGDPATGEKRIDGGGDMHIIAGANINNGVYFVAKGDGEIKAEGNIGKQGNTFGTVLALQGGHFDVAAGGDAKIEAVINPTMIAQDTKNATIIDATGKNSYFNSYSGNASANVTSLRGNAQLNDNPKILSFTAGLDANVKDSIAYLPASVTLIAHNGNSKLGDASLMPAAFGQLEVLAAKEVVLGTVQMSDAAPSDLANINAPISKKDFSNVMTVALKGHDSGLLHRNDTQPSLIVAKAGNISAAAAADKISLAEAAKLVAGQDVLGLNVALQNNRNSDISLIKAGQDIKTENVTIAGPGELLVQAGRNVDLIYPDVTTIEATGNTGSSNAAFSTTFAANPNSALPTNGASISLQAGLGDGAALQNYIDRYISPTGAGPATLVGNAAGLAKYRESTNKQLTDYMRKLSDNNNLSDAQAFALFNAADSERKAIFVNRHLSSELVASGQDFSKTKNHDRGNNAIATLFPKLNQGDILLFNSKVSTNSGGSIDLTAPGGMINVGVPRAEVVRTDGEKNDDVVLGIITEKRGQIRAIADGDFQVNQSKVITQFGDNNGLSDIAIWSTHGTIDAGRGSKSATSIPERIVQTDAYGNTIVEVRGVAAGSGIRAQSYDPDGPNGPETEPKKGAVYLTAPIVDAGEAGIEAGDIFVVAPVVLNAANIQVQGASSGVPLAATTAVAGVGVGVSPDAVNSAAQSVAKSVAQSAAGNTFEKPKMPSVISVDVISIGK